MNLLSLVAINLLSYHRTFTTDVFIDEVRIGVLASGFCVLCSGLPFLISEYRVVGTGFWVSGSGLWILANDNSSDLF